MIINFVGNFQTGYVGEVADQIHLARELEALGHIVRKLPQDEWREYILSNTSYPNIPSDLTADLNLITKWHHFFDERFIVELRKKSDAPVFYWLWDYMDDQGIPDWHLAMAKEADLYLTNEYGNKDAYVKQGITQTYYFPFDVADATITPLIENKIYDVVFFGSYLGQGDRVAWLKEINKITPVKIFSWNADEWKKQGFDAESAVYGEEFAKKVAQSKIILGFSVEPHCWGYWSNRVGKVLTTGGFLLYQYAPGMELFLRDGVEYFSSITEAQEKIDHYLIAEKEREEIAKRGLAIGRDRFTSKERVKELMILAERFIKTREEGWKY